LGAVDLVEVGSDLPGGQAAGGQRQHDLVDPVQPSLAFAYDDRVEAGVAVAGHLDLHGSDLGQHGLGAGAVARVGAVAPGRVVALISEVLAHLRFQGGLEHRFGQPGQQSARAHELDAFGAGGLHELLGEPSSRRPLRPGRRACRRRSLPRRR
jgi:hypothetical protein